MTTLNSFNDTFSQQVEAFIDVTLTGCECLTSFITEDAEDYPLGTILNEEYLLKLEAIILHFYNLKRVVSVEQSKDSIINELLETRGQI